MRSWREILAEQLDYRRWREFRLWLVRAHEKDQRLTPQVHAGLSGGEKAAALHLPLFAAAHALFAGARPDCPRLIALDEAFAGIDDLGRPELLSLAVRFDLDLFMTGYDLWITWPCVPAVAHYDLQHLRDEHVVAMVRIDWNGRELVEV
jgi:energy-coupling factor transporter ATP-binding protein EcfA2